MLTIPVRVLEKCAAGEAVALPKTCRVTSQELVLGKLSESGSLHFAKNDLGDFSEGGNWKSKRVWKLPLCQKDAEMHPGNEILDK